MDALLSIFQRGLQKTATSLRRSVAGVFGDVKVWDAKAFSALEEALLSADFGVSASRKICDDIRDRYSRGLLNGSDDIIKTAQEDIASLLRPGCRELKFNPSGMTCILLVGVNGSGKTTTAGKLAHLWSSAGRKVSLAACDTFRAAAVEQLKLWAEKTKSHIISSKPGADPSSVAFDAVKSALARGSDILIIDTAGRQQNKKGLMEELSKMRRTISKVQPDAPHETLLTIDSSIGLNALSQAKEFAAASGASGLVLTKLDGTGKGGAALSIQSEMGMPILFVGLGEAPDDLQPFDPEAYAKAVFSDRD